MKSTDYLSLDGLRTLDVAVARELATLQGLLSLDGLLELSVENARELRHLKRELNLNGLRSLSRDVAVELGRFEGRRTMKFKIDPSKRPKQLDLEWDGLVQPGIYKINGVELKVCYDQDGKTRPTTFNSPIGSNMLQIVLKKKPD